MSRRARRQVLQLEKSTWEYDDRKWTEATKFKDWTDVVESIAEGDAFNSTVIGKHVDEKGETYYVLAVPGRQVFSSYFLCDRHPTGDIYTYCGKKIKKDDIRVLQADEEEEEEDDHWPSFPTDHLKKTFQVKGPLGKRKYFAKRPYLYFDYRSVKCAVFYKNGEKICSLKRTGSSNGCRVYTGGAKGISVVLQAIPVSA